MPSSFPHHYEATIVRTAPSRATLEAPPRPAIAGGAPPQFGGDAASWSPEHLLLASLGLCLETTFDALAARDRLAIHRWAATVHGTLDRTPSGLAFTRIAVALDIGVDPDAIDRAQGVLDRTRRACIVSAALRVPVEIEATISAATDAAA